MNYKLNKMDQELRDIFHSYRPEIGDEDAFMDKLSAQMDAIDAKQQQPRIIPLYRKWLPWAAGIAAAVVVALILVKPAKRTEPHMAASYPYYPERTVIQSMSSDPFSSFEETVAEIERSGQQLQLAIAEMKE